MSTKVSTRAKRTWRQDPAGRRARILDAAAREFARKGYQASRVDGIALAAGVAEGTVYHQFQSKRGLLVAVGEAYGRGLARAAFGDPPREFHVRDVQQVVDDTFHYVRDTRGSLAAFFLANDPEEGGPARDANREQMLAVLEDVLASAIDRGDIPDIHPRITAEILFGIVENALKECFIRHRGDDELAYKREVTRCMSACLGQV